MTEYVRKIPDYGDLMMVDEFIECCKDGTFIDYDGHGAPVRDGMVTKGMNHWVYPSEHHKIPSDATHIIWFNR